MRRRTTTTDPTWAVTIGRDATCDVDERCRATTTPSTPSPDRRRRPPVEHRRARADPDVDDDPDARRHSRSSGPVADCRSRRDAHHPAALPLVTRPWPPERIVRTAFTTASLAVTTLVMMRVVHFNPFEGPASARDLIFDNTTPDRRRHGRPRLGARLPARRTCCPTGSSTAGAWTGTAACPSTASTWSSRRWRSSPSTRVLPYGVAFKFVAMSGMVSLPFCCWAFGRLARFRYPVPELFAFAGLCFALNESYSICGGNVSRRWPASSRSRSP